MSDEELWNHFCSEKQVFINRCTDFQREIDEGGSSQNNQLDTDRESLEEAFERIKQLADQLILNLKDDESGLQKVHESFERINEKFDNVIHHYKLRLEFKANNIDHMVRSDQILENLANGGGAQKQEEPSCSRSHHQEKNNPQTLNGTLTNSREDGVVGGGPSSSRPSDRLIVQDYNNVGSSVTSQSSDQPLLSVSSS